MFQQGLSRNELWNLTRDFDCRSTSHMWRKHSTRIFLSAFLLCKSPLSFADSQKEYKYVVLGYGVAGQAAVSELLKDKTNSILILEKKKGVSIPNKKGVDKSTKSVISILPDQHKILLEGGDSVSYQKLLLACGRQYSFSNSELVDQRCKSKVIHLHSENSISLLTNTVKSGGHVTLVGGSWVSIAFASYLAHEATLSGYTSTVTLLIPGSGPLQDALPRPFSVAIMNRLRRVGVEVYPYMQLRYVGVKESLTEIVLPTQDPHKVNLPSSPASSSATPSSDAKFNDWDDVVGVHCVQSYDLLKTYMFATDFIVPICESSDLDLTETIGSESSNSFLSRAGFEVDRFGCVVVNPSLAAVDDVYAAGDLANILCDNGRGYNVGMLTAAATGSIAAQNMRSASSSPHPATATAAILSTNILNTYHATALLMGANIRFYGDCSTSLDTFSYWWNHKKTTAVKQTVEDPNILNEERSNDGVESKKPLTALPLGKLSTRKVIVSADHIPLNFSLVPSPSPSPPGGSGTTHQSELDILGTGVIFYVDSNQTIRGVAVCGTLGNPYYLHHYINMSPAYLKASQCLGHAIDLPTLPSRRVLTSVAPKSTMDVTQQTKYLESIAVDIFQQIQLKPRPAKVRWNELDERPKSKYSPSVKKKSSKDSPNDANRTPWRWTIQPSSVNEKLFH
jgi:NADPH-dependent 2,4-dienoyl-CoA reductase/sulfur reductase-like enzyme